MNMNGGFVNDNRCGVSILDTDIKSLYQKIKNILENKLQIDIEPDQEAQTVLKSAEDESERFLQFSNKALRIRNNDIDREELNDYLKTLASTTFKRTLMPYQLLSSYLL